MEIDKKKYEQYGEAFLEVIRSWREAHPEVKTKVKISTGAPAAPKPKHTADDRPSHMVTYQMFQSGKSLKDIAAMRALSPQTIENHLFKAAQQGHPLAWEIFFSPAEEAAVLAAYEKVEESGLKPLRELLPEGYSYTLIKAVLVKHELFN